ARHAAHAPAPPRATPAAPPHLARGRDKGSWQGASEPPQASTAGITTRISMIPPITRNSQSGACRLPDTINPAISTSTSPSPVDTSQIQFCSSRRTNPANAPPPFGAAPASPAAFSANSCTEHTASATPATISETQSPALHAIDKPFSKPLNDVRQL